MTQLQCRGRDGHIRTFYLELVEEADRRDHEFAVRVHRDSVVDPVAEWVDFRLGRDPRLDGGWRVVMVEHYHKDSYAQRGIIDALIPALVTHLKEPIYSSTNGSHAAHGEWRTRTATAVWERLRQRKPPLAAYDEERDRYRCPPNAPKR